MLQPNHVPSGEPEINVGIILPEDNAETIRLTFPKEIVYELHLGKIRRSIPVASTLTVLYREDTFSIKGLDTEYGAAELRIAPVQSTKGLKGQSGVRVGPVVAGRGFHWQKMIDVFLPDTLWFRSYAGKMTLINQMPLEHYVMCVATSEMGAACPEALIESQTIAARSWILANVEQKHNHMMMDVCNDDCCQRYQGTSFLTDQSARGAMQTGGQVVMYQNTICDARYSKSCGGMMESFDAIWDGPALPYLQVKPDTDQASEIFEMDLSKEESFRKWIESVPPAFCSPHVIPEKELIKYLGSVDEEGAYFRWETEISQDELAENLQRHAGITVQSIEALKPLKRAGSGRITRLEIIYKGASGERTGHILDSEYQIRQILSAGFLYSSAIAIEKHPAKDGQSSFRLKGGGWGHGVGYCQIGALGMSLKGFSSEAILKHYFPGSNLIKLY